MQSGKGWTIEMVAKIRVHRFSGYFDLGCIFFWAISTSPILPSKKECKLGQNNPKSNTLDLYNDLVSKLASHIAREVV
jgi:hypothetical protein